MYWADKGNIFNILKNSLHESLFLAHIIFLISFFFKLNTHMLLVDPPPKSDHRTLMSEKGQNTPFLMHQYYSDGDVFRSKHVAAVKCIYTLLC